MNSHLEIQVAKEACGDVKASKLATSWAALSVTRSNYI